MPGFVIGGQGGGAPFGAPSNVQETRRRHRWVFETLADGSFPGGRAVLLLLQKAARPNFILEEPVLHHNQEQAYFAGKQSWNPIELTWYDGEQPADVSAAIFGWVNSVVSITGVTVNIPSVYKKDSNLRMLDGAGSSTEHWRMFGCWPKEVNWQDLDYMDTEIQTVVVTMRYDRANRVA